MGRGGGPKIEAIKFAETEMVQTQDAGVAAPVKGLLRRLPLQEWAQAAAEGVPQFLRDAVAAELLVGDRGQKRAAESGLELREADRGQTPDRRPLLGETDRDPAVVSRGLPEAVRGSAPPSGSAQKYFAFVLVIIPAVPRTLFIFSCANYKYSWMIMVVIAYATFVVNIGAKCHPIWRCIDASSLC